MIFVCDHETLCIIHIFEILSIYMRRYAVFRLISGVMILLKLAAVQAHSKYYVVLFTGRLVNQNSAMAITNNASEISRRPPLM